MNPGARPAVWGSPFTTTTATFLTHKRNPCVNYLSSMCHACFHRDCFWMRPRIEAATADLQQYSGTASFAADWTAQAKLLVRDGKDYRG